MCGGGCLYKCECACGGAQDITEPRAEPSLAHQAADFKTDAASVTFYFFNLDGFLPGFIFGLKNCSRSVQLFWLCF